MAAQAASIPGLDVAGLGESQRPFRTFMTRQAEDLAVVPDAERGEEVCAVVVPRPGHSIEVDTLLAWGKENLAHHKYPRLVRVLPEQPVGPPQKVLKRELRRQFSA